VNGIRKLVMVKKGRMQFAPTNHKIILVASNGNTRGLARVSTSIFYSKYWEGICDGK
jgi:hypothetical protein